MQFTDTHCHIHEAAYPITAAEVLEHASEQAVGRFICVGTDEKTSVEAVAYVQDKENMWASVGLHPHDSVNGTDAIRVLEDLLQDNQKIIAIGECGLDYFYDHSPKEKQLAMLHAQMKLAQKYNLPMIFHVRDASPAEQRTSVWNDFWPIFDEYEGTRGVIHSFTDTEENLQKALDRGLYIGVNGISTFTKNEAQTQMYKNIPLEHLLLETDAPFLTPVPMRGKVNEPAFVTHVAHYIANLQSINLEELSRATEQNATHLFSL